MNRIAVVALLGSGCIVVPKSSESTTVVAATAADRVDDLGTSLVINAAVANGALVGTAESPRNCTHTVTQLRQTRRALHPVMIDVDERGGWSFLDDAILAPVTLAVSGVVTGIILLASHVTTTRAPETNVATSYCPRVVADGVVAVTWPSGAASETTTDARGAFAVAVPPAEPSGLVTMELLGTRETVRYQP